MLPSYEEVRRLVEDALERLSKMEKILVFDKVEEPLTVVGDIHGDLNTLKKILGDPDVKESLENGLAVFLGDYIDRGPRQVEVIVELLSRLTSGQHIILLRGNHEPPEGLKPIPHDFPYVLVEAYGERGRELYKLFLRLFEALPYAAIVKGFALFLHGGPPTWIVEDKYSSLLDALRPRDKPYLEVLEQILWNDPHDSVEVEAPSPRGAGKLWGWKVTEAVIGKGKVKYIIRGHEPADLGYKFNHGGKVLTIFSRIGPPYFNVYAAYLVYRGDCEDITECVKRIG